MPGPRRNQPMEKPKNPFSTVKRLAGYMTEHIPFILLVLAAIVFSALANVIGTSFLRSVIDDYLGPMTQNYTPELMAQLSTMSDLNIPLLLTGAYVGSDPVIERDTVAIEFMRDKLHFTQRNNHSSQTGNVMPVDGSINRFAFSPCTFTTAIGEPLYRVEAPDALEPAGDGAMRIYRYQDTSMSAGVAYDGEQKIVVLGFPFETIIGSSDRARIMGEIMNFLTENK